MRSLKVCPIWIAKATTFSLQELNIDTLLEKVTTFLENENISFITSSKHYKIKGRLTSFLDYCDFTIRFYSERDASTTNTCMEWTQQNGSRTLFFHLFREAEEQFVHVKQKTQDIWDLPCDLSPRERTNKWNEICTQSVEDMPLDIQYQHYYTLVLIAHKLNVKELKFDTDVLTHVLCNMCSSPDYEVVRFACVLLSLIEYPLPEKVRTLLRSQVSKMQSTFQTTHVLHAIQCLL